MYIEHKTAQKVLLAAAVILTAVLTASPSFVITPMQGLVFIFFIFFIHSNIEKRFIIKQYSMKNEEQNKLLEKIYSSCPDSISYKDYNFKYQLVNDVMSEKICRKNKSEIINKTCYELFPKETADIINKTKRNGGRLFSVGTTSTRTIESFADDKGLVAPGGKWTDLFIYQGYKFKAVDALITNFHFPDSTPLCMVSAFATEDFIYKAYSQAVELKYRFYSFGDSMLIL